MGKIKILYTIPNFTTAGSGREMVNIIERLDKELFECVVCIQKGGGPLEIELRKKGYQLIVFPFNAEGYSKLATPWVIIRLGLFFRKYGFTLWHSFHWSSDFTEALIARIAGARFIFTKKNMNWSRKAWKIKSRFSHHIIARNTTMLTRFFHSPYYQNKVIYIPGGVDVQRFSRRYGDKTFRQKYELHPDAYVITTVAQLIPIKGQHVLINAVKDMEGVVVFLAGAERNAAYAASVKKMVHDYNLSDRIFFLGEVTNIPQLLNESDLFVLATTLEMEHEEGCPVSLMEAMACGIPCVASNVAGSNDLIRDKENGLLFKPGNSEDLKQSISMIMKNKMLANKIASQAAKDILDNYSLTIEAENFQRVYSRVARDL